MQKPYQPSPFTETHYCHICKKPITFIEKRAILGLNVVCVQCYDAAQEMGRKLEQAVDVKIPKREVDDKHEVSDKVLEVLKNIAYQQDDYGIEKYKKALKHSYNYDWMAMFFEEIVDGLKYLQNEMDRRAVIKQYLQLAIKIKDWEYVQKALDLLNINGTGK